MKSRSLTLIILGLDLVEKGALSQRYLVLVARLIVVEYLDADWFLVSTRRLYRAPINCAIFRRFGRARTWNGNGSGGVVLFECRNRTVLIQRNFLIPLVQVNCCTDAVNWFVTFVAWLIHFLLKNKTTQTWQLCKSRPSPYLPPHRRIRSVFDWRIEFYVSPYSATSDECASSRLKVNHMLPNVMI